MQFELEARADRRAENSTLYCFRRRYAMRPPFRIPLRNLRRRRKKKPFGFFRWRREWDSNPRDRKVKRFSRPPRYDRFDIPPYLIVKYHYTARVFAGDCIQPKYSITSAPDCQYFFENALGELVGLSMICYTEAQKIIESSFGRIPVKRAHGKVIVFAKMNRKLRLKVLNEKNECVA